MIGVAVVAQTPKQFVASVRMLNGAGFAPSRLTLGRAIYLLPNAGALSELRSVSVPGELKEKELSAALEAADAIEIMLAA